MAGPERHCRGRKPARNQRQDHRRDALLHHLAGDAGRCGRPDDPSALGHRELLHWVMDMAFRDDECRIGTDNAPPNFATCRHIAYNLTRKAPRSIRPTRSEGGQDCGHGQEAKRQAASALDAGSAAYRSDQSHRRRVAHRAGSRQRFRAMLQRASCSGGRQSSGGSILFKPRTTSSSSNRCSARSTRCRKELGEAETLLADTGYFSAGNEAACEAAGIEPLIAMGRQPHHPPLAERFAYSPPAPKNPTPVEAMAHRPKNARRKEALLAAQTDPGTSVRHHQTGTWIPQVPAARARQGAWRVEPRDHGMEHQADVYPQLRLVRPGAGPGCEKMAAARHGRSPRGRDAIRCPSRFCGRQNRSRPSVSNLSPTGC